MSTQDEDYRTVVNMKRSAVRVNVVDQNGTIVSTSDALSGTLFIKNVQLWWPYTMNSRRPAYLYTLEVCVCCCCCRTVQLLVSAAMVDC